MGDQTAVDALTVRRNSILANHQARALLAALRAPFTEGAVVAILGDTEGTLTSDPVKVAEAMGFDRIKTGFGPDIRTAARAIRGSSWPGEMAQSMEDRADRLDKLAAMIEGRSVFALPAEEP